MRARLRRLLMGLATLSGQRPRGFFVPYRHAAAVDGQARYPAVERLFEAATDEFHARLARLETYAGDLARIGVDAPPPRPRWGQDWFPRLDGAMAYAMVRDRRPRRIVEIGSGHSTRFLASAIADGGLTTRLIAIDPEPRAALDGLAVDWRRALLQDVSAQPNAATPVAELAAGDMLVIDSSHVLMPGSDVDLILNQVLPLLPSGALVHIHDVFLPDPYPVEWSWRGYNEQNGVAALLLGGGYMPIFASHWAARRMAAELSGSCIASLHLPAGAHESSLWLEKR